MKGKREHEVWGGQQWWWSCFSAVLPELGRIKSPAELGSSPLPLSFPFFPVNF